MVGGHKAYGLYINRAAGYRDNSTSGVAVNGAAEGMYMVASGTHVNSGCCFDFGNAETNTRDNGAGHMDAVNLTTYCEFSPCSGSGPWVEADMENGQFVGGNGSNPNDTSSNSDFVTAVLKNNGQTTFELKAATRNPADCRPTGTGRSRAATRRCTRRARSCSAPAATTATPRSARSSRA